MKSKNIVSLGIMAALFTGMVLTGCGQTQQMGATELEPPETSEKTGFPEAKGIS